MVIPLALISISVQIDVSFYHYFPWLNSSEVPQMKIDTVIFQDVLGCCTNNSPTLADQVLCVQQVIYIPIFTEMCQHKTTASPNKVSTSLKRKWFILPNPGPCLPLVSHNHVSAIVSYEDNVDLYQTSISKHIKGCLLVTLFVPNGSQVVFLTSSCWSWRCLKQTKKILQTFEKNIAKNVIYPVWPLLQAVGNQRV